jgi:hypothetical protein
MPTLLVVLGLIGVLGVGLVVSAMGTAVAMEAHRPRVAWWWLAGSLACLVGLLVLAVMLLGIGVGDAAGTGTGGGWR